jgi:hypothetical protein
MAADPAARHPTWAEQQAITARIYAEQHKAALEAEAKKKMAAAGVGTTVGERSLDGRGLVVGLSPESERVRGQTAGYSGAPVQSAGGGGASPAGPSTPATSSREISGIGTPRSGAAGALTAQGPTAPLPIGTSTGSSSPLGTPATASLAAAPAATPSPATTTPTAATSPAVAIAGPATPARSPLDEVGGGQGTTTAPSYSGLLSSLFSAPNVGGAAAGPLGYKQLLLTRDFGLLAPRMIG